MNDTSKPKFVTCKYTNLHATKMNGRLNREYVYMYSLRGISEVGDIIVNYTCPYDIDINKQYFEDGGVKNIINIEYDLKSSPWHPRIDAIKDKHPHFIKDTGWINRNVEIMWGKFLWMEEQLQKLEDDDTLYWIDCGLSHGGILNSKQSTHAADPQFYREDKPTELQLPYAHRHDKIFNKDFSKKLDAYTGDKVMFITVNNDQHGDKMGGIIYDNRLREWPIGGLWGGKKKNLLPVIERFKELVDIVLTHECLVKEEQLMAVILNEHPERYKTYKFETWYHLDWNCYNPDLISFCSFFDILNNVPTP